MQVGGLLIAGALAAWVLPDFCWQRCSGMAASASGVACIFADLIILPILNIYRKYYGLKIAGFLFATLYVSMAGAALIVELIFNGLGMVPDQRNARVAESFVTWNSTTWLY